MPSAHCPRQANLSHVAIILYQSQAAELIALGFNAVEMILEASQNALCEAFLKRLCRSRRH